MTRLAEPAAATEGKALSEERLSKDELQTVDAYWRACTYLAAGMIYLRDNPLLREPLKPGYAYQYGVDKPEIDEWTWRS